MNKPFIFLFQFLFFANQLMAQEPMTVIRCTAPELQDPIQNIYVDKDNKKWVGNSNGLFQVHAIDFATTETIKPGDQSLLKLPNGNSDITWSKSEMDKLLGGAKITAAFYDTSSRELWVGTEDSGIIRLKTKPALQKAGEVTSKNSKLKSNKINAINKDQSGRFWIGTDEGVLIGELDKWKLAEKFFTIEAISINRDHIWVMGDETVWKVEEGDEFYPIDIDERMVEGSIRDIAADSKGRVWIASDVVARYNFEKESHQLFGPAQYFTSQDVNYIAVDKDDALWVGTQDKGLFLIEKASAITVTLLAEKGLSCDASKPDAALKVKITGGQPPYFYQWDKGLKGENPQNLAAGEYALTVTDDKGKTKSAKIIIPDPRFTIAAVQDQQESGAGAGDAAATVSISGGGLPDFKFKWDNGETTAKAVKLTEGLHTVTVTDQNGCTASTTVDISQKLTPLKITINQTTDNNCATDQNAALEVVVQGGKPPYQYKWNDAIDGEMRKGLSANQYTVTVTDATGVVSSGSFTIKAIAPITANIAVEKPASTGNADGKAKVTANGGNGNFSYKWDNGETTQTATQLAPGSHSVTVTDAKGCSQIATTDISENILALSVSVNQTAKINCFGESTAALSTSVSGGKGPFQYTWNKAGITGENPTNVPAGAYEVTIKDATGKTTVGKTTVEEPSQLAATTSVQAAATTGNSDGKATVKASGGSGDYTYKWDNNETGKAAKSLSPGTHSVTITDEAGCSVVASVDISENILELNVSIAQTAEIDCQGNQNAALMVEVNGGKGPFKYQWNNNSLAGEKPGNIGAGNYALTLTDATGTTRTAQINIQEPKKLEASISVQQPASTGNADGKAMAAISGGDGKYSFKWDNGETEKTATQLAPGKHTLTITDGRGCTVIADTEISENILPLAATINQVAELDCYGDKKAALKVNVSGGKAPFKYQWNNATASGDSPNNLPAGDYQVTITDATGLTKTAAATINQPSQLAARIVDIENTSDQTSNDGEAKVAASGGAGNYSFAWDNGQTGETGRKFSIGKHQVVVKDAKGCETTVDFEIKKKIIPELRRGQLSVGQIIRLSELYFDADSTVLNQDAMPILDEITYFLEQNPTIAIEIGGHTNGVPPAEYCDALSTARAESIATYIYGKGIAEERVKPVGYGKRKPIASNKTADGRKRNQRVELTILSL